MLKEDDAAGNIPARDSGRFNRAVRLYADEPDEKKLRLIVIISDGIRGHINQSRGVAAWLSRDSGAEVEEIGIPELKGAVRRHVRASASKLIAGDRHKAREWLALARGEGVVRALGQLLLERGIREGQTSSLIILSAGSIPAFFNLALGYIWRCTCVTIMTPSVVGTDPFQFAIVPEHDYPGDEANVMTTVGAPNSIVKEELGFVGESLLREFPPKREYRWGILIGGNDKNYRISAEWMHREVGKILREAVRGDVDLYISTSRRTSPEAENAIRRMVSSCENTRFLLIASSDPFNPIPAILGACDEIFVTDDSVNMVSEAVTAGHRVILLRTERAGAVKQRLQLATSAMVSSGIFPRRALWGVPRFDETFRSFRNMGLLIDFKDWIHERRRSDIAQIYVPDDKGEFDKDGFNEARRAAGWILSSLPGIVRPEDEMR
ncbi:MAG: mitochondrial fission ELM1 family protein [Synergistaceae bacterium]|jgi:mitochondrial fission protein ELM1|nr:mitochondrial fission ELM1 family protein [Synergistaceae bacterium]